MDVFARKMSQLGLIASICITQLSSCKHLNAEENIGITYEKAVIFNANAVETFDVRVVRWRQKSLAVSGSFSNVPSNEVDEVYRCVVNLQKKSAFRIRRAHDVHVIPKLAEEKNKSTQEKTVQNADTSLVWHDSGTTILGSLRKQKLLGSPYQESFEEFCRKQIIEMPHCMGCLMITPDNSYVEQPVGHGLEKRFARLSSDGYSVTNLPDGNIRLVKVHESPTGKSISTRFLDPKSYLPFQITNANETDGERKIVYNASFQYRELAGVFLPASSSYSREYSSMTIDPSKSSRLSPASEIGTVELQWNSVNERNMSIPTISEFALDPKRWQEFLKANKE